MIQSFKLQRSTLTFSLSARHTESGGEVAGGERRLPAACVFLVVKQPTRMYKCSQANRRLKLKLPSLDAHSYNPSDGSADGLNLFLITTI